MKMTKEEFIEYLIRFAEKQGINISEDKANMLYIYKQLLLEWNEKINLTAITEDDDIIVKHFVDSLLSTKFVLEGMKIIDVGTGAGFPGIVIAIYYGKEINITLLDSLNKRINFLNDVIKKLELDNVKAIHGRAEEMAHNIEYREKYDVAIARAVAPLNILLEYLSGYVKVNGKCVCMKSINVDQELNSSTKAVKELGLKLEKNDKFNFEYKEENITRNILVYRKDKPSKEKYPRMYSKIKKTPL